MKEEIKRIINDLEFCKGVFDYTLSPEQSVLLVGYIKKLQEENEIYERQRNRWKNRSHKLATKCDKQRVKLQQICDALDEIKEYVIKHRKIYDIDGSIEKQLDEFDILASPKRILQMLDKVGE